MSSSLSHPDAEPATMTAEHGGGSITSVLHETRVFPPPAEFAEQGPHRQPRPSTRRSGTGPRTTPRASGPSRPRPLDWFKPWDKVLDWKPPFAKWFVGGQLNASYNCVDRHCDGPEQEQGRDHLGGRAGRPPGPPLSGPPARGLEVRQRPQGAGRQEGRRRRGLHADGPRAGRSRCSACARIGAPHTVVFGGFSAEALAGRIQDCKAKVLVTADGGYRRGKVVPLKENADGAAAVCPTLENVVVYKRTGHDVAMDRRPRPLVARPRRRTPRPTARPSRSTASTRSTSSTPRARPASRRASSTRPAATSLGTTLTTQVGLRPQGRRHLLLHRRRRLGDRATPTWSTARSPTARPCVMYEGAPNWPDEGRFWKIIEDYRVTILYTAPTAIRAFMKWGEQFPSRHDLSSLRLLGTVGEPINPEAWMWYHQVIGGGRCPIVDTWWQTETGAIMISPAAGRHARPSPARRPARCPGIVPEIVTKDGKPRRRRTRGASSSSSSPGRRCSGPSTATTSATRQTYWSEIPGCYFTGDGARRDEHGNYWIMGRVDDVLNVAGHRLSTMEVESALVSHPQGGRGRRRRQARRAQGPGDRRVRHPRIGPGRRARRSGRSCAPTSSRRSAPWPGPTTSASPTPCPRPAAARSCAGCSATSPPAVESTGDTSTLEDLSVLAQLRRHEQQQAGDEE